MWTHFIKYIAQVLDTDFTDIHTYMYLNLNAKQSTSQERKENQAICLNVLPMSYSLLRISFPPLLQLPFYVLPPPGVSFVTHLLYSVIFIYTQEFQVISYFISFLPRFTKSHKKLLPSQVKLEKS